MPPIKGKPLILYISTTTSTLGAFLKQNDHDEKEMEIYYISRKLVGYEINYISIECAHLAVVIVT